MTNDARAARWEKCGSILDRIPIRQRAKGPYVRSRLLFIGVGFDLLLIEH